MKVRHVRLMPFHISLLLAGEPALCMRFHRASPSLGRAATAGGVQEVGHAEAAEGQDPPPAAVARSEVQERAGTMFSGATGTVVASGKGASDIAGGSGDLGSDPSHGGRRMVGCLGGLFRVADGAPGGLLGAHLDRHRRLPARRRAAGRGGRRGRGGGLVVSVDGAARVGAALGPRGARRSGVRAAMARHTAVDAPPERARAARTVSAEPRSRGWLRMGFDMPRAARRTWVMVAARE